MSSLTPRELYALANIDPAGTVEWGTKIPSKKSGVYVVSIDRFAAITFSEPFETIERKNWREDQDIVYIGRATVLTARLRQFYKHVYGKPSPHRGGQAILLLNCAKNITWAEVDDFGGAEDRLIKAFQSRAGRMPFGNRVRSAEMKSEANRFVAEKDEIGFRGKLTNTVNHLSPEEESANQQHDEIVAGLFDKKSD